VAALQREMKISFVKIRQPIHIEEFEAIKDKMLSPRLQADKILSPRLQAARL
jgi:Trk K+ transport system NAD-binding subunit